MMIRAAGSIRFSSATHLMPEMPGSSMSMSTTSGFSSGINFNASSPVAKAPRHSMSGAVPMSSIICCRNPLSSSTKATVVFMNVRLSSSVSLAVTFGKAPRFGSLWVVPKSQAQGDLGALAGLASYGATPAKIRHSPFDVGQAVARRHAGGFKTTPVILNGHGQLQIGKGRPDVRFRGGGMFDDIMQRLLHGQTEA